MIKVIFMGAGQGDSTLLIYPDGSTTRVDCGSLKNKAIVKDQIALVLDRYLPKSRACRSSRGWSSPTAMRTTATWSRTFS